MRRADRLFAIVQYLRGRRLTTAAQLAGWLEVSERTIYRDVADLAASGVPIDGEAGVGYRVRAGFDLPPLMFTFDEIDALVIGARFVESWGGPALGRGARSALAKIAAALPGDLLGRRLDAGCVVRAAAELSQFPAGPDRCRQRCGAALSGRVRETAGRLRAQDAGRLNLTRSHLARVHEPRAGSVFSHAPLTAIVSSLHAPLSVALIGRPLAL